MTTTNGLSEAQAYALIEAAYGLLTQAIPAIGCERPIDWRSQHKDWLDAYSVAKPLMAGWQAAHPIETKPPLLEPRKFSLFHLRNVKKQLLDVVDSLFHIPPNNRLEVDYIDLESNKLTATLRLREIPKEPYDGHEELT